MNYEYRYELAKKLKEAGFIADWEALQVFPHKKDRDEYEMPTLEEIIEACGKEFKELVKGDLGDIIKWVSFAHGKDINGHHKLYAGKGKTSSEAVANLWLELNTVSFTNPITKTEYRFKKDTFGKKQHD